MELCYHFFTYKWLLFTQQVDFYRFSIAWTRIIPDPLNGTINEQGIDYYNKLIDGLRAVNITPLVTIYHWDLPQILQETFGGWNDSRIIKYYTDYADVLFRYYGDRVNSVWYRFLNFLLLADRSRRVYLRSF